MSVTFTSPGQRKDVDGWGVFDVNMSNTNAVRVAESLGFRLDPDHDGDLFGQMDAEKFLGHVVMAWALAPTDEGMPAHELAPGDHGRPTWAGEARWIEAGRRPGYLQDRLRDLMALAQWAVENNQPVQWA